VGSAAPGPGVEVAGRDLAETIVLDAGFRMVDVDSEKQ